MTVNDPGVVMRRHSIAGASPNGPVIARNDGAHLVATDGTRWLDAATGGFGSGHPDVTAAIAAQAHRVALSSRILLSRPLAEALEALDAFSPAALTRSYLCNSGSEALDSALKLAKGVHPQRRRVLSVAGEPYGCFTHGLSLATGTSPVPNLPLTATPVPVHSLADSVSSAYAAVVVAPAALGRPLEHLSPRWWMDLRDRCARHDVLLIVDERQTGPARLGSALGISALGVVPDVIVLGEALGADTVPIGAMITSRSTFDRVYARTNPSLHGSTFGANPLAAATVSAVLRAVTVDELVQRQQETEHIARTLLGELAAPVTEFCANGSLVWLRLAHPDLGSRLVSALAARRVLVRQPCGPNGDVVAVLPPLIAAPREVEQLFLSVQTAVREVSSVQEVFA